MDRSKYMNGERRKGSTQQQNAEKCRKWWNQINNLVTIIMISGTNYWQMLQPVGKLWWETGYLHYLNISPHEIFTSQLKSRKYLFSGVKTWRHHLNQVIKKKINITRTYSILLSRSPWALYIKWADEAPEGRRSVCGRWELGTWRRHCSEFPGLSLCLIGPEWIPGKPAT